MYNKCTYLVVWFDLTWPSWMVVNSIDYTCLYVNSTDTIFSSGKVISANFVIIKMFVLALVGKVICCIHCIHIYKFVLIFIVMLNNMIYSVLYFHNFDLGTKVIV